MIERERESCVSRAPTLSHDVAWIRVSERERGYSKRSDYPNSALGLSFVCTTTTAAPHALLSEANFQVSGAREGSEQGTVLLLPVIVVVVVIAES